MARLFLQDLANVESGIYPLPADHDGPLLTLINRSWLFFEDLPEIHRRREGRAYNEIFDKDTRGTRPRYYLQNFHYQSGGWLTDESAERYDTQVEVLLNGTANAMRRQALPQLHELFAGRDQRQLHLLDIGCGTGRFLDFVKQAWPRLQIVGQQVSNAHVRFGSEADIATDQLNVRFTPESGHWLGVLGCLLCAIRGQLQVGKGLFSRGASGAALASALGATVRALKLKPIDAWLPLGDET
jgi:SAM-dependent methyltransferase